MEKSACPGRTADLLANQRRYGEAITAFQKAAAKAPRIPKLNDELGLLLAIEGRYEEAAPYFERELAIDPQNASAHRHLGIVYMDHRKDKVKALFHSPYASVTDYGRKPWPVYCTSSMLRWRKHCPPTAQDKTERGTAVVSG
ncbi:MAG: tetratricopeptide repeat protein [Candidatus Methylomirabilales bacterium]